MCVVCVSVREQLTPTYLNNKLSMPVDSAGTIAVSAMPAVLEIEGNGCYILPPRFVKVLAYVWVASLRVLCL